MDWEHADCENVVWENMDCENMVWENMVWENMVCEMSFYLFRCGLCLTSSSILACNTTDDKT